MRGFIRFIRKQGVVGLAVGFVLGAAVAKVVSAFVTDIVNPLVGLLLGKAGGLKTASFHVGKAEVLYGDFLAVLLDFMIIAAVIYFSITLLRLDRLDERKDDKK